MGAQAVRLSNIDIDNAMESKDFEVLFQPIFDLGNGALARMETFVRWRHPELGVLPPGAFISFFENQGRMSELTRYVLAEALAGYTRWRGPFAPGFSINLALTDLSDDAFANHFVKLLRDRDFPADLVTLECPMPPFDADMDQAAASFERLSKTGARLAIEVRGRANDFLRNIDPFPFDEIKTGGSSILRFARTVRGPGLSAISDLLDIANKANAAITAVGVEDQASLAALRGLGFTAAQGNHLAKVGDIKNFVPSRVNEVRELLGLPPLSSEDLASLFRTSAPEPRAAETPDATGAGEDQQSAPAAGGDARDERPPEAQSADATAPKSESGEDADKRARAREKAKALVLAKRARARAARKAAAIQRAKAKAAQARQDAASQDDGSQASPTAAPRDLQQRLAQEFTSAAMKDAASNAEAAPAKPQAQKPQPAAAQKQDADPQTQPAAADAAAAQGLMPDKVQLQVGAARAHFQPGIRVGGQALDQHMETSSMRRAAQAQRSHGAAGAKQAAPAQSGPGRSAESAPAQPRPEQRELGLDETPRERAVKVQGVSDEKSQANALKQGHLMDGEEPAKAAPAMRARKSKNFLTRKYRVRPPNHFWPKSWKRRYRRWKSARTPKAAE